MVIYLIIGTSSTGNFTNTLKRSTSLRFDPLVSHLLKASRVYEEWKFLKELDLTQHDLNSLVGIDEHLPNLSKVVMLLLVIIAIPTISHI